MSGNRESIDNSIKSLIKFSGNKINLDIAKCKK